MMRIGSAYLLLMTFCLVGFMACAPKHNVHSADGTDMPMGEAVELVGVLVHHQWSKSTLSYCAGGSDYWTLEYEDENGDSREIVLRPASDAMLAEWERLSSKEVGLLGHFRKVEKEHSKDPYAQHPVGEVFTCTVFAVLTLEEEMD